MTSSAAGGSASGFPQRASTGLGSCAPGRGPKVVAFGGGTGMSALLNGLKEYTDRITAVVTVTDNGGSSGRLRNDFEMAPPGDIRNCLLALADIDPLVAQAFQYRFGEAEFKDHCFGNLFITVLTRLVGDFGASIRELNRLLNVRGRVIPATSTRVSLVARHPDGSKSTGEVEIARSGKAIEKVEIRPAPVVMSAEIRQAVEEADLFLFGPGSLYTSVIPNLLLEGIVEAINATGKERVYVANIMTQPGETDGYALSDHIRALRDHVGAEFPDAVVAHQGAIPEEMLCRYRATGAEPVRCDLRDHREFDSVRLISSDFFSEGDTVCEDAALQGEGSPGAALTGTVLHGKVPRGTATRGPVPCRPVARGTVRHDPAELARVLYREFLAPFELQDRAASQEGTEAPGRSVGITVEAHETRALG